VQKLIQELGKGYSGDCWIVCYTVLTPYYGSKYSFRSTKSNILCFCNSNINW